MKKSLAAVVLAVCTLVLIAASAFAARDAAISFELRNRSSRTISRVYVHDTSVSASDWDADDLVFKGESIISYADYAIAMIDEATKGDHIQQRISVVRK